MVEESKIRKKIICINNIIKIIGICSIIVPIPVILFFIKPTYTLLSNDAVYYDINYIFLIGIEIVNVVTTIIIFIKKEKLKKSFIIIYCIYIILSALIPIYHIRETRNSTESLSYLMGLEVVDKYNNIYGIDISGIINMFYGGKNENRNRYR